MSQRLKKRLLAMIQILAYMEPELCMGGGSIIPKALLLCCGGEESCMAMNLTKIVLAGETEQARRVLQTFCGVRRDTLGKQN